MHKELETFFNFNFSRNITLLQVSTFFTHIKKKKKKKKWKKFPNFSLQISQDPDSLEESKTVY